MREIYKYLGHLLDNLERTKRKGEDNLRIQLGGGKVRESTFHSC